MEFDQTTLQIDLDILEENLQHIHRAAGTKLLGVVKADAYGVGSVVVAQFLEGKCDFFGVANLAEALQLRAAGVKTPILVLGRMPISGFPYAVREDIRPSIFQYEDAVALSQEAMRQGKTAPFHLAVDTGMSRIGCQATAESAQMCAKIAALPGVFAEGLFSHYACADHADLSSACAQTQLFDAFDAMLKENGVNIPIRHLNNSAGIINFPGQYEMSRVGIALYGMLPSNEVDAGRIPTRRPLKWSTYITYLKSLPAGRQISYGGTFTTTRDTLVATLPVGYADGYLRNMTGKAYVLIRGKKAPVLGKITMDQIMVDVTDIPDVAPGDEAVLFGCNGEEEITVDQLAAWANVLNYEIICGIHSRVPRVYIQGGKEIKRVNHLLAP